MRFRPGAGCRRGMRDAELDPGAERGRGMRDAELDPGRSAEKESGMRNSTRGGVRKRNAGGGPSSLTPHPDSSSAPRVEAKFRITDSPSALRLEAKFRIPHSSSAPRIGSKSHHSPLLHSAPVRSPPSHFPVSTAQIAGIALAHHITTPPTIACVLPTLPAYISPSPIRNAVQMEKRSICPRSW